ncbi:hypothetical protein AVEN_180844-1 [Araneus ventricosus]|uniref:Uncharacterized protein n=1 Tax=Araneus ventricosus TaxID=182803 RepID=A0A4Y2H9J1_ARAVE|nr:hypothetical protein AVEN_180844-1 [Araneus ventricosus]
MQFPSSLYPCPSTVQEQTNKGWIKGRGALSLFPNRQKLIPLGHVTHLFGGSHHQEGGQEMKVRAVAVSDEGDVSDYLFLSSYRKDECNRTVEAR